MATEIDKTVESGVPIAPLAGAQVGGDASTYKAVQRQLTEFECSRCNNKFWEPYGTGPKPKHCPECNPVSAAGRADAQTNSCPTCRRALGVHNADRHLLGQRVRMVAVAQGPEDTAKALVDLAVVAIAWARRLTSDGRRRA